MEEGDGSTLLEMCFGRRKGEGEQACGWAATLAGCAAVAWEQEEGRSHGVGTYRLGT